MAQWYYVYAPISGTFTALSSYCDGSGPHPVVDSGFANPIDIGAGGSTGGETLYFIGSSNIQSIYAINKPGIVCAPPSPGSPWADGMQVNIYNQPEGGQYGGYLGSVFYAHVQYPIGDGAYNVSSGAIAYVPYQDCACGCYQGAHSHIEQYGGYVYDGLGWGSDGACYTAAYQGSSVLFGWYA